jgi:hypothetical protein
MQLKSARSARSALLLPPLFLATSALAAEPETIDEAMERQRTELRIAIGLAPCPTGEDGEEIVVCARRGPSPYSLPNPDLKLPGERERGIPNGVRAMNTGMSSCSASGLHQRCSGGLNVFQAGAALYKIGRRLLGRDD